jgi:hypothetical protein
VIRAFHLQPGGMHLGGTTDIVLPLLFPAEKTSCTAFLARQLLLFLFLRAGHDTLAAQRTNRAVLRPGGAQDSDPRLGQ